MSCEEFWNKMPELDSSQVEGNRHLTECVACAGRFAREHRLAVGLRALAAELGMERAPQRVEANLAAAFRAAHGLSAQRRTAWWKAPVLPWAAAGFAAAALAFAFWAAPRRHVEAPAARHSAPSQVELASLTSQDSDDGFIQLPNAPQMDPNDDVNVVRMELPRSAMLAVGLDVNPEQVSETVEAEVMLGSDGLARAVRFME